MNTKNRIKLIKDLKELKDNNLISDSEYETEKSKVLSYKEEFINQFLNYLSKLAWPIFGIIVVFLFYFPLTQRLSQSSEITIGSFSLKIKETANIIGDPELASKLENLSPLAIELLIDMGGKHMNIFSDHRDDKSKYWFNSAFFGYLELENMGLLNSDNLLKDINSWIWEKDVKASIYYKTYFGFSENFVSEDFPLPYTQFTINKDNLSNKEIKQLEEAGASLNKKGIKTWNLIVSVVIDQLKNTETKKIN